jgi:hypothetical protein
MEKNLKICIEGLEKGKTKYDFKLKLICTDKTGYQRSVFKVRDDGSAFVCISDLKDIIVKKQWLKI